MAAALRERSSGGRRRELGSARWGSRGGPLEHAFEGANDDRFGGGQRNATAELVPEAARFGGYPLGVSPGALKGVDAVTAQAAGPRRAPANRPCGGSHGDQGGRPQDQGELCLVPRQHFSDINELVAPSVELTEGDEQLGPGSIGLPLPCVPLGGVVGRRFHARFSGLGAKRCAAPAQSSPLALACARSAPI